MGILDKPITPSEREMVSRMFDAPDDSSLDDLVDIWFASEGITRLSSDPEYLLKLFCRITLPQRRIRDAQKIATQQKKRRRVLLVIE